VQPGDADRGIRLVDGAIRGDPQVELQPAFTGAQSGRALVAGAGLDAVENDHAASPGMLDGCWGMMNPT
jgi:hypothetical protein